MRVPISPPPKRAQKIQISKTSNFPAQNKKKIQITTTDSPTTNPPLSCLHLTYVPSSSPFLFSYSLVWPFVLVFFFLFPFFPAKQAQDKKKRDREFRRQYSIPPLLVLKGKKLKKTLQAAEESDKQEAKEEICTTEKNFKLGRRKKK